MRELEINLTIAQAMLGRKIKIHYCDYDENKEWPQYIPSGKPWRTHQLDAKPLPNFCKAWWAYGQALEWAKEKDWWERFAYERVEVDRRIGPMDMLREELLNPLTGSTALAEFIQAHPEYFKKEGEKE